MQTFYLHVLFVPEDATLLSLLTDPKILGNPKNTVLSML